jgi:Uncharacterized protein conserved in bacteria (DUF2188)
MIKVLYKVVKHENGWAYQVGGTFSEAFATHDQARAAAHRAAREQRVTGEDVGISFEDENGHWHDELSLGNERPDAEVSG